MIRQLLEQLPAIPDAVSRVYQSCRSQGSLQQFECERLVAELIREVGRVYLVVDAFDECDAQHRATFLRVLGELSKIPGFRLLVTSRPHTRGVTATFTSHVNVNIAAREEDIRLYLHQELARKGIYEIADETFANGLVETLARGANGM
jgi:Cys-tRNA synthase (O-phospho-L-seryl-tRNA:Cys-tRNA synthase)